MVSSDFEAIALELGDLVRRDVPLGPLCTYRVGGTAKLFVEVNTPEVLEAVAAVSMKHQIPVLVVGKGSNLLVADSGFAGLAVSLGEVFSQVEISDEVVRAGASAGLPVVARRSAAAGLTGFEWAVGVPGSVGGAVRMNAGGHGSMMSNVLVQAKIADLHTGTVLDVPASELELGYRQSNVASHQIVLEALLELKRGEAAAAEAEISKIVKWRREHQPGGRNAGSVFANPPGDSAGHLIDAAGAKGLRRGSAEVSTKHANFIQVDQSGCAADVVALMGEVRQRVYNHSGVVLYPETRLVGLQLPELLEP